MLATTAGELERRERRGIRPMDPARDLRAIADLMEVGFADELDARARLVLRDMRWMARISALVWWWNLADPSFQQSFSGFVWEEPSGKDGRPEIVGNASLNRAPGNQWWWIVCNVVVRADFRGRGIARRLTERTIAEARQLGAEGVVLQVYQANRPALRLYLDLGFEEVGGETDLRLERSLLAAGARHPVGAWHPEEGYSSPAWRPRYGHMAYELALQTTPREQQWIVPVEAGAYGVGRWSALRRGVADWLTGKRTWRLAALHDGQLAGLLTVTASLRGEGHHLGLVVHPDHAGRVEAALISQALYVLEAMPPRPLWATVSKDAVEAVQALRRFGFEERRTLLTMSKRLR